MKPKNILFFLIFLLLVINSHGQGRRETRDSLMQFQDSRNGYILPVSGHIRILVVFAEVIYDTGTDPCPPGGTKEWPAGSLPQWKDMLFDPYPSQKPNGKVSAFFHESGFGGYQVTGDYLMNPDDPGKPVQIKFSERISTTKILEKASEFSEFKTQSGFSVQDFDLWTLTHAGHEKHTPSLDNPLRFDHVMIIIRNSNYPSNLSGWTAARSAGRLFGYENDTYSFFCTHEILPFNILLHEYAHMMFGGNNFHAGGSHSKKAGYSYFPHIQGGWGMMGAAWKSFLTTNAWERRRLGWKSEDKKWYISCLDSTGQHEIPADLDAVNLSHEGVYLIRDFVTTGDALRIKLPHLPDEVFPQWIWIENHQTKRFNDSRFDVFQYEHSDCMDEATAGLYIYLQVDKEDISGRDIFSGYADYLRPLPANGLWDFEWGDTAVQNPWCINNNFYFPHSFRKGKENPFSGSHEMELVYGDYNQNGKIEIEEYRVPAIRKKAGGYQISLPVLGAEEHAYTITGNNFLGIGTNPSTSSLITAVTSGGELSPGRAPNNRTVYLNGISIEILSSRSHVPGAIYLKVRFDDFHIKNSVRWCADTIVLPSPPDEKTRVLTVFGRSTMHIDRGQTPTRINDPDKVSGKLIYTKPTVFILDSNTALHLKDRSVLKIENGSTVIVRQGARLKAEKKTRIIISGGSQLLFEKGSEFERAKGVKIRKTSDSRIIFQE